MQLEARSRASGDVVFREQLSCAVVHVAHQDFRKDGCKQVIACLANGEVRGYSSVASLSAVLQVQKDVVALEQVRLQFRA
jgi:Ciliary BBSome complex subunit 2, C-terminal